MIPLRKISLIGLTFLSLLISELTFSQIKKDKKIVQPVSKIQSDTTNPSGVYSALVYFSGNGLPNPQIYTCFGPDLDLLMKLIDSASNGATVTFDHLNFLGSNGTTKLITEIPYNFKRAKDKIQFKSQSVQEVEKLRELNFVSGTLYFSGFGFAYVTSIKATDTVMLYKYYSKSGPGTTITLDNCIYKNANGSLSDPLSKSMKLE